MRFKPNKTVILVVILVISGSLLPSCTKYLSKKPDSSVAVPTTLNDLQSLLDYSSRMNLQTTSNFGEASADDYFLPEEAYNELDVYGKKIYTWTPADYSYPNDWSGAYEPIYTSNYCLDQIQKIQKTEMNAVEWNNVYGSSLFYRSYYFLDLLWAFAKAYDSSTFETDLGIVLRTGSDFSVPSVRSNVKDCYMQVLT
ncbi:MAG TPA: RagB/SusD family nutrient uptake outer membrane protein, partial [Puia sp.]